MITRRAFTLVELLVVISVIGLLMAILLPALGKAKQTARTTVCKAHMRQVAMASQIYCQDNNGYFAKSNHSAWVYNCQRWGQAFSPYLGAGRYKDPNSPSWKNLFSKFYRCPADRRTNQTWSYGKNVWFELDSGETGGVLGLSSGPTYLTSMQVRRHAATIEFADMIDTSIITMAGGGTLDHFMAQDWVNVISDDVAPEVDKKRHCGMANYSYLDGHVLRQDFEETLDYSNPNRIIDNWNPGTAR